jgi:CRISPR-associated protein Csd1
MTVLQALNRYYDRMADRGEVVAPGYSVEPVGIEVVLAADGTAVAVNEKRDPEGKKPNPEIVPKWFTRQGNGSTPFFLWDNTAYALGISKKNPEKSKRDHAAFRQLHLSELAKEFDPALLSLRLFVEKWSPDKFISPLFNKNIVDQNVGFRLNGDTDEDRSASVYTRSSCRSGAYRAPKDECIVVAACDMPRNRRVSSTGSSASEGQGYRRTEGRWSRASSSFVQ